MKNILYAFTAQGISLFISLLMSFIIPKILGVSNFAYWQLFLFYTTYISLFHFGLNDGIYLNVGGMDYIDLDKDVLSSQLKMSIIIELIISIIFIYVIYFMNGISDLSRMFVMVSSVIFIVIGNATSLIGMIFQAVDQTAKYSISVMVDKVSFLILLIPLVYKRTDDFQIYIIIYIIARIISFGYCFYIGRQILKGKFVGIKITVQRMYLNCKDGINITIAYLASLFIVGSGRMVVDNIWGIDSFGKFSFSLMLSNFFMLFITQMSMVLFPALKKVNSTELKNSYCIMRNALGVLLPAVFLLYVPAKWILLQWLPEYEESLTYMILILPICTFDGKMQLLCTTYFKVLRKEKMLMLINIISMLISVLLSIIGGYILHDIYIVVFFMIVTVACRSIISELLLASMMQEKITTKLIIEISLVLIFVLTTWFIPNNISWVVNFCVYVVYFLLNYYYKGKDNCIIR